MWKILSACFFLLIPSLALPMGHAPAGLMEGGLIGKTAPEFTLDLLSGERKSLTQAREGKKAMLFFWATWCPHCHEELQALNSELKNIEQKGIKVLLVDLGETKGEVHNYFKDNNLQMDSFVDMDGATQEAYNLVGVPTVYFIDSKGIIRSIQHKLPSNYQELFG